jgi:hypothetical protein
MCRGSSAAGFLGVSFSAIKPPLFQKLNWKSSKSNGAQTRARMTHNLNLIFYLKARDWRVLDGIPRSSEKAQNPPAPSAERPSFFTQVGPYPPSFSKNKQMVSIPR